MGWKPDMTKEQRDKLNASRRKQYATRRAQFGLTYTPKNKDEGANYIDPALDGLPKLDDENLLDVLRRLESGDKATEVDEET